MKDYRKWSVAMTALAMAFVLGLLGKLTGDFSAVATICVGAFAAANAFEHHSKRGDR